MAIRGNEKRLLIVDDDQRLLEALVLYFDKQGYRVYTASEGDDGLRQLYKVHPDLVILDIMLPRMSGWEVCERIRQMTNVPIIMLTARGQESDRVKGLEMGADDYVAKPFSLRELAARVEAVLRRSQGIQEQADEVVYGDDYLVIDAGRMEVQCAGEPVNLTATERRVLFLLARNQGRLLTAGQILSSVWGPDYVEEVSYVRLYIWRLRQKIEPVPDKPRYILTEHGMGYRFIGAS
jgi:two-component system KDP operon response regulator KdpE